MTRTLRQRVANFFRREPVPCWTEYLRETRAGNTKTG